MGTLFLTKEERIYNGAKWCWENWTSTCKTTKVKHLLAPYTMINSEWIKDLNVRQETIKPLEEIIGRTLNINQSKIFYDPPPIVTGIKTKVNKWDLINSKAFVQQRKL